MPASCQYVRTGSSFLARALQNLKYALCFGYIGRLSKSQAPDAGVTEDEFHIPVPYLFYR